MAVDRGGLRYTIEIRDKFSATLKRFRGEVRALKKELVDLRTAQAQLTSARRQTSGGAAAANRQEIERLSLLKQQVTAERLRADILRTQRGVRSRAAREEIAAFRTRKQAEAKASAAGAASARKQVARQRQANKEVRRGSREFNRLTRSANRSQGAINRVSFTFRRLFGIFAAFQAARAGASLFRGAISQGIQFNQTVQDATISLAALFSSAGQVTDEQGRLLKGAEAFAAATGEARRQIQLLRQDALGTTATFQELLRAFQAGVGPGLEASLRLDEIREITVRVSQAAQALLVPQNQLIEEIRSLLRGTIQARTTIVASVLGITNEDIRRAKETGTLFEFIRERLGPFAEAAEATRGSFTGLVARIRDASSQVTGAAAGGLFQELTQSMLELFDAFTDLEENTGILIANADAVKVATPLFEGLAVAIREIRDAAKNISLDTLVAATTAIGQALRVLINFGAAVIQGIVAGLADISNLFKAIAVGIGGLDLQKFSEWLSLVTRIATVLIGLNLTFAITKALFFAIIAPLTLAKKALDGIALSIVAVKTASVSMAKVIAGGVLVGLIAAGVVLKEIVNDFAGFNVKISTFFRIVKDGFVNLVTVIGATINLIFTNVIFGAQNLLSRFFAFILNKIANFIGETATSIEGILPATFAQLTQVEAAFRGTAAKFAKTGVEAAKKIQVAEEDLANASLKFFTDLNQAITDDQDGLAPTALEMATSFLDTLKSTIGDGLDKVFAGILPTGTDDDSGAAEKGEEDGKAYVSGFARGSEEAKSKLQTFFEGIVTNFETGLAIIRPLVQQFASFISDAIVSAFDPTDDTPLLEKFARFLQNIAKLIIQTLVQVAIAKAVLGFINPTGTELPGGTGLAEGGDVPDGKPHAAIIRPKGLDPRDTQPIWAQPGEFMVKKSVVDQPAVREFLRALNAGAIDPNVLGGLLGSRRTRRHISGLSSRGPQGYAEGDIIRQGADSITAATGTTGGSAGFSPAVLAANDETMEKLLAGGGQAFRRHLEDNAQEFDGILRSGRSGG